jgi:tetratricopeptide (TPR) repeat protein
VPHFHKNVYDIETNIYFSVFIIAEDYGEEEKEGEEDEDEEVQAQRLIQRGEIDKAITIYQRLETDPRILNIIGLLYAEKKGDYDTAINYYKRALKIQEKVNIYNEYNDFHYIVYFF